jgi:hypothetical protein
MQQVSIQSDRIIVTQRGGATTLLGKYAYACRYSTAGGTAPGPQGAYYQVEVYFDEGKGPVSLATGNREDTFVFDLRAVEKSSQPTWGNTEQGAQNAVDAITTILRAEECCPTGTPGAVIAVNQAQCWNLLDPTWGLQPLQLTECVIPSIDFCDEEFKAALTPEQLACINDTTLCEVLGGLLLENADADWLCIPEIVRDYWLEEFCEGGICPLEIFINDTLVGTVADPCVKPTSEWEVRDEANTQVGVFEAPNIWRVPTAESLCSLVTSSTTEEVVTCIISSGKRDAVRCDLLGDVEPENAQTQILDCVTEATEEAIRVILSPLKFGWGPGDADTLEWEITSDEAGTYGTYTQDGSSGTITYSLNGGAFAAVSGTIVLTAGDDIIVRRTSPSLTGFSKWAA